MKNFFLNHFENLLKNKSIFHNNIFILNKKRNLFFFLVTKFVIKIMLVIFNKNNLLYSLRLQHSSFFKPCTILVIFQTVMNLEVVCVIWRQIIYPILKLWNFLDACPSEFIRWLWSVIRCWESACFLTLLLNRTKPYFLSCNN